MDYLISFLIGGVICALVQILLDRTKLMPGRVMVCLVCGGVILGFAGLYQPFQDFAKAGASVPLLGFGNVLWKGVKEAVDKNGFIGPENEKVAGRKGFRRKAFFSLLRKGIVWYNKPIAFRMKTQR